MTVILIAVGAAASKDIWYVIGALAVGGFILRKWFFLSAHAPAR